jgi:hypothetical protein
MANIKLYMGQKTDLFAFLTFNQIGYILAGHEYDFVNCDRKVNAGIDWFEHGTENDAEAAATAGKLFEPSGECGVTTSTEPFDVEVVMACTYGGVHDFEAKGVYHEISERGGNYKNFDDRREFFAQFVREQAHAYGIYRDKLCCEVSCLVNELKELEDNNIE